MPETTTDTGLFEPMDQRLYGLYARMGLPDLETGEQRKPSYFYAIRVGARVKLGRSVNPVTRMTNLQLPEKPDLLATAPEWILSEKDAHERWSHLQVHREWFRCEPELLDWLASEVPRLVAIKEPLAQRLRSLRRALAIPVRPLQRLMEIERRVAKEIARERKERERLAIQRRHEEEKARGCGLCGERKTLLDVGLPRWVCTACKNWFNLGMAASSSRAILEANELRRQARQVLELQQQRVGRLAALYGDSNGDQNNPVATHEA